MRRKCPSRRKLKARFMHGRPVALQDVYERRLDVFVRKIGYDTSDNAMLRRKFPSVKMTLDGFSPENVRMAFLGEEA